jgi:hypothetical protein
MRTTIERSERISPCTVSEDQPSSLLRATSWCVVGPLLMADVVCGGWYYNCWSALHCAVRVIANTNNAQSRGLSLTYPVRSNYHQQFSQMSPTTLAEVAQHNTIKCAIFLMLCISLKTNVLSALVGL